MSISERSAARSSFVDAYCRLAQADLAQHAWSAAYASLEKAIELEPSRCAVGSGAPLASRDFTGAEGEAKYILKQAANHVAAHQLLGVTLIGQQKPNEALAQFSKVTELRPNDQNSYVNLPLVEISLRHFEDAEHHLKKAVAVDAESIQAYTDLANFYRLQGRRLEAEQVLQDAIAKNPDGTAHNMVWEGFARSAAENMHNKVIAESGV